MHCNGYQAAAGTARLPVWLLPVLARSAEVRKIWFTIYAPRQDDRSPERLRPPDREPLFDELPGAVQFPRVHWPRMVLDGYRNPLSGRGTHPSPSVERPTA